MTEDANKPGAVPSAEQVYAALAEQFPTEAHKKVKKGGREQTYLAWTDKVERFNKVLGQNWSFRIVREGMTATEAWALGEITATIGGVETTRQQYGCEAITKAGGTATTDLLKIAGTDALSKAATLFGCGLYLSIQEERAEVEAAMQEAVRAAVQAQCPKAPASITTTRPIAPTSSAGAPAETPLKRWERLVAEAEAINLPKLGAVKAVDSRAVPTGQLISYSNRLEASIAAFREQQGAA